MEMEIYELPNVVEIVGPTPLPQAPKPFECALTPNGKVSWFVRPRGRLEVFQVANRVRTHPEVHCVLLDLPREPSELTRVDLRCWAEEVAERAERPVVLTNPEARYPCGEEACCRCHHGTQLREAHACFETLVQRADSVDAVIDQSFKQLSPKDRQLLRRWATQEDVEKPKTPIRQKMLAAEMKITERQVRRILEAAKKANKAAFAQLEHLRTFRYKRTGAYEVR